ncbi:ABC transporter substrate-binding protein [Paenibacillus aurantiacus]|uniref:ABC transporter substrate-binding protein n=1 Tax=Paenibacillus aurantiacus TaxID=1936118 RepID=A0ABV5KPD4_9BACL
MKGPKRVFASLVVVSAVLVQGCSGDDNEDYALDTNEAGQLKVMYVDEDTFNQQYGNAFNLKYPNIEIEVVAAQPDLIEKENPDVILMNTVTQYSELVEKGTLLDLEPMLVEEDFKSADLLAASLQLLREQGSGKLFGISPYFSANALYYNKDLFDKFKVPLPTERMTWPEVIELAKRFPTTGSEEERVYGFTMDDHLSSLGFTIGDTTGFRYTDAFGKKVTIQTDGWKQAFGMAVDAQKSGAFYFPGDLDYSQLSFDEYLNADLFFSGKAAMTLKGTSYAGTMKVYATLGKKPINWGWLTEPYDPANPDVSSSFALTEIYGVNANSANKKAAWQLVKDINGDVAAKLLSKTNNGNLMTRTQYNTSNDGVNYDPFYTLQPRGQSVHMHTLSDFNRSFRQLTGKELQAVVSGSKSLDEAMTSIQNEGQLELDRTNKQLAEAEKTE